MDINTITPYQLKLRLLVPNENDALKNYYEFKDDPSNKLKPTIDKDVCEQLEKDAKRVKKDDNILDFFLFLKKPYFDNREKFTRHDEILTKQLLKNEVQFGLKNIDRLYVVTHIWEDKKNPDVYNAQFKQLKYLLRDETKNYAVFYDYSSLFQKIKGNISKNWYIPSPFTSAEISIIAPQMLHNICNLYKGQTGVETIVIDVNSTDYCLTRSWACFEINLAFIHNRLKHLIFIPKTVQIILLISDFIKNLDMKSLYLLKTKLPRLYCDHIFQDNIDGIYRNAIVDLERNCWKYYNFIQTHRRCSEIMLRKTGKRYIGCPKEIYPTIFSEMIQDGDVFMNLPCKLDYNKIIQPLMAVIPNFRHIFELEIQNTSITCDTDKHDMFDHIKKLDQTLIFDIIKHR